MAKRASFFGARAIAERDAPVSRVIAESERPASFVDFLMRDLDALRVYHLKPPQIAIAYLIDGWQPGDVPEPYREHAIKFAGGVEHWEHARDVYFTKGARIAGTLLSALYLFYVSLWLDMNETTIAPGEEAYIPVVAPRLKTARQVRNYVWGAAKQLCGENKKKKGIDIAGVGRYEGFRFKRVGDAVRVTQPDGTVLPIECFAASAGGASVRGLSMPAALMDESAFFRSEEHGAINDAEIERAISPRILGHRMCRMLVISTAWSESGILYDATKSGHGKPASDHRCILARTEEARPCDQDNPIDVDFQRTIDRKRKDDPRNAMREYDCVAFSLGGEIFFSAAAIEACVDDRLFVPRKPPPIATSVGAAGDFAFKRNASAFAIVYRMPDDTYAVSAIEERLPAGVPLKPSAIVRDFASIAKAHGATSVMADEHERSSIEELFADHGLAFDDAPAGLIGLEQMHVFFRSLINEGKIRLPRHQKLIQQLKEVVAKPLAGGRLSFDSPTWRTGEHGDVARGAVTAAYTCHHNEPLRAETEKPRRGRNFDADFERELNRETQRDFMADDMGFGFGDFSG